MATETAKAEAMVFAAQQANVSKARRQKFPAISLGSLTKIADEHRFHKFAISPLSPTAFPARPSDDQPVTALRHSILDKYLEAQEGSPSRYDAPKATTITLAASGIAEALPTPAFPPNIGAMLDATPVDAKPRIDYPKAPAVLSEHVIPEEDEEEVQNIEPKQDTKSDDDTSKNNERALVHRPRVNMSIKPPLVVSELDTPIERTVRMWPVVGFSQDDSGLLTPPPAPTINGWTYSFEHELPQITLKTEPSIFDPPPAPCMMRFPLEFPASPRTSGPAPLDTSLQIVPQLGSAMNSPVAPEAREEAARVEAKPPSAPITDKFPVELPDSPLRAGPSPLDTSIDFRYAPDGSPTPTQAHAPVTGTFPRLGLKPAPIAVNRHVRFAVLESPMPSNLKSPGLYYIGTNRGGQTPSPSIDSPVTPKAMNFVHPKIASAISPPVAPVDEAETDEVPYIAPLQAQRGRVYDYVIDQRKRSRARTLSPPRSNRPNISRPLEPLPAKTYDPNEKFNFQVDSRTLEWACPRGKGSMPSYNVSDSISNDRKNILQSYFNRTTM